MDQAITEFLHGENKANFQHWCFLLLQILSLPVCGYLWFRLPAPGVGVAIIAVVGGALAVQEKMPTWRKFLWMWVILVLFVVEYRSISKDRAAADAKAEGQRQESIRNSQAEHAVFDSILKGEQAGFSQTLEKLKASIVATEAGESESKKGFSRAMQKSLRIERDTEQLLISAEDGLKYQTGGDSFAYLDLNLYGPKGPTSQSLSLYKSGNAPLYDLEVQLSVRGLIDKSVGETNGIANTLVIRVGNLGAGDVHDPSYIVFRPKPEAGTNEREQLTLDKDSVRLTCVFVARNGVWWEDEWLRNVPDPEMPHLRRWVKALQVRQKTASGEIRDLHTEIDAGFPMDTFRDKF